MVETVNTTYHDEQNPNIADKAELEKLRQRVAELEQANVGLQQELTQLAQAKEAIQRERDGYHYVLMNVPAAVIVSLGPEHTTKLANQLYLQMVGRDPSIEGRSIREIFPELKDQGLFELMDAVYSSGKPFLGQERPIQLDRNGDGSLSEGFFNFIYHPIVTNEGRVQGVFAHALEVTEQVKARQALERERQRLYHVFMNAPASIAILRGPNHIFELTNAHYMRLIGRQTPIVGLSVLEALPEVDGQGFVELLDEVYQTGKPFIGQEMPLLLDLEGNGKLEQAFVNFVYQPLFASDGSGIEGIFVHAVEVTEQVQARQKIEELSHLKDEFLAVASHDLCTPITSIKAYLQLIQRSFIKQQQIQVAKATVEDSAKETEGRFLENNLQTVNKVLHQVNQLNELINRLLDFSRIAEGQLSLQYTRRADLMKLVREVVANLSVTAEQQVLMQASAIDSLELSFDEVRLEQVLNNLIGNAIKYSPVSSTITVGVEPPPPGQTEVVVWVRDQGYGISSEQQKHLFERFYQVQSEQNVGKGGLGLGLYISSEIVKKHGGRLWVESKMGQGSTFYITLPTTADY